MNTNDETDKLHTSEQRKRPAVAVSVFDYDDYRIYLRDKFEALKKANKRFSHRYFARLAGLSTSNFASLVMNGKRNLSQESIARFADALGLDRIEREYFAQLVLMNQSKSLPEKNRHFSKIARLQKRHNIEMLQAWQLDLYAQWYYPIVLQVIELCGFRPEPTWIAKKISPSIKPEEVSEALRVLADLKLIEGDKQKGLRVKQENVSTGNEVRNLFVRNFHASMLDFAKRAMDEVPRELRDVSSLTLTVNKEQVANVKAMIADFRKKLLAACTAQSDADTVYQLNMQFFPMTKP